MRTCKFSYCPKPDLNKSYESVFSTHTTRTRAHTHPAILRLWLRPTRRRHSHGFAPPFCLVSFLSSHSPTIVLLHAPVQIAFLRHGPLSFACMTSQPPLRLPREAVLGAHTTVALETVCLKDNCGQRPHHRAGSICRRGTHMRVAFGNGNVHERKRLPLPRRG